MRITSNSCHGDACNVPWHGSRKDKFPMPPHDTASASNFKVCTKCGESKPATAEYFPRHKNSKDGFDCHCKACKKIVDDAYRAANRVRLAERQRAYRAANRESISERRRIHYQANREIELERRSVYRAANRKRLAEYQRAYDVANPERKIAYGRIYRAVNREHIAEHKRAYYKANRERVVEYQRAYRAANRKRIDERNRIWRKANRDLVVANKQRRRFRKLQAEGTHTAEDVQEQYKRQKGRCFWCGEKVGDTYHVDHIVPLARGGSNWPENLVIACASCNCSRQDKLPHEWPQGGRLL